MTDARIYSNAFFKTTEGSRHLSSTWNHQCCQRQILWDYVCVVSGHIANSRDPLGLLSNGAAHKTTFETVVQP